MDEAVDIVLGHCFRDALRAFNMDVLEGEVPEYYEHRGMLDMEASHTW